MALVMWFAWERFAAADTLIYVDLPLWIHYSWVTKRLVKGLFANPKGWPENSPLWSSTLSSYRVIPLCHRNLAPKYRQLVAETAASKRVHHLRSVAQIQSFIEAVNNERLRREACSKFQAEHSSTPFCGLLRCMSPFMAHRVNSLLPSNRVALGVKRTTTSVRHATEFMSTRPKTAQSGSRLRARGYGDKRRQYRRRGEDPRQPDHRRQG